MKEFLEIGSAPSEEDCAQVGSPNYSKEARIQVQAFINQIKRTFPKQFQTGIQIKMKTNQHDFGTYYEAAIYFDENSENQVEAAFHIEHKTPIYWDEEAIKEMNKAGLVPSTNSEEYVNNLINLKMAEIKKKYPRLYRNKWEKASNYAGADLTEYFGVLSQHRDSHILERSNYKNALMLLNEAKEKVIKEGVVEDEETPWIEDAHSGHWAVGWVDQLLVHFNAPNIILSVAEEILKMLEQYPIINDDDYNMMEDEEIEEYWENEKHTFGANLIKVIQKAYPNLNIVDYNDLSKKDEEPIHELTRRILDVSRFNSSVEDAYVDENEISRYFKDEAKYDGKDFGFSKNDYFNLLYKYYNS